MRRLDFGEDTNAHNKLKSKTKTKTKISSKTEAKCGSEMLQPPKMKQIHSF